MNAARIAKAAAVTALAAGTLSFGSSLAALPGDGTLTRSVSSAALPKQDFGWQSAGAGLPNNDFGWQ